MMLPHGVVRSPHMGGQQLPPELSNSTLALEVVAATTVYLKS